MDSDKTTEPASEPSKTIGEKSWSFLPLAGACGLFAVFSLFVASVFSFAVDERLLRITFMRVVMPVSAVGLVLTMIAIVRREGPTPAKRWVAIVLNSVALVGGAVGLLLLAA